MKILLFQRASTRNFKFFEVEHPHFQFSWISHSLDRVSFLVDPGQTTTIIVLKSLSPDTRTSIKHFSPLIVATYTSFFCLWVNLCIDPHFRHPASLSLSPTELLHSSIELKCGKRRDPSYVNHKKIEKVGAPLQKKWNSLGKSFVTFLLFF